MAANRERLDYLNSQGGPVVVVAMGHSGTRFLARILQRSGVFMGADLNNAHDSMSWHEDFAMPIMTSAHWPILRETPELRELTDRCLDRTLTRYLGDQYSEGLWGWKGSTLFVMPIVDRYFPGARYLHLIRDGRDVVLSQDGYLNLPRHYDLLRRNPLTMGRQVLDYLRHRRKREQYRLKVFFGTSDLRRWQDVNLDRRSIEANRYLLQMQCWMHNVETAREFGRRHPDRYMELRYERLVTKPVDVVQDALQWIGLEMDESTREYASSKARKDSLRKWRTMELDAERRRDLDRAIAHGRPLLDALETET